jgi:hypothetical protein
MSLSFPGATSHCSLHDSLPCRLKSARMRCRNAHVQGCEATGSPSKAISSTSYSSRHWVREGLELVHQPHLRGPCSQRGCAKDPRSWCQPRHNWCNSLETRVTTHRSRRLMEGEAHAALLGLWGCGIRTDKQSAKPFRQRCSSTQP